MLDLDWGISLSFFYVAKKGKYIQLTHGSGYLLSCTKIVSIKPGNGFTWAEK